MLELLADRFHIGKHLRCDHRFIIFILADDDGFRHKGVFIEVVFYFLRVNIFAVFRDDHVFDAAGDSVIAVFIHRAEVAGVKKAILIQHLCRGLRIVIIAEHHHWALHADLTYAGGVRIDDLRLYARQRHAHGIRQLNPVVVADHERRAFRQAIAEIDRDAKGFKILDHFRANGRSARDNEAKPAAEGALDFAKYFIVDIHTQRAGRIGESLSNAKHQLAALLFRGRF